LAGGACSKEERSQNVTARQSIMSESTADIPRGCIAECRLRFSGSSSLGKLQTSSQVEQTYISPPISIWCFSLFGEVWHRNALGKWNHTHQQCEVFTHEWRPDADNQLVHD
jgi:hypothetical protein